jgi:ribosomal protein L11 methyltransferase
MSYSLYEFYTSDEMERDWLISILNDYGFEGYEETAATLKAYVPEGKVTGETVKDILSRNDFQQLQFSVAIIEERNWNEEWEKNFEPVIIADKIGIRAPFHPAMNMPYELIIEPKMSFGTGHHATTASVLELMLSEQFVNKSVLDFGSGTGVLAILAEKLKASKIIAVDNDEWAYNNCVENIERNGCVKINAVLSKGTYTAPFGFDIILANINRNVILDNIQQWRTWLKSDGVLMVSGILLKDENDIIEAAGKQNLKVKNKLSRGGWVAIAFAPF